MGVIENMINSITEILRHIMTLYFGVFVTTAIIGIKNNRKNILVLNLFCIGDLLLHLAVLVLGDSAKVLGTYPLFTHLPLLLLLMLFFQHHMHNFYDFHH